jgi:heme A synthase
MLGYSIFVLVFVELVWSLSETLTESAPGKLSSVKSKIIVGLMDIQVLLGVLNLYFNYTLSKALIHAVTMVAATGTLHVANKKDEWVRVGLQGVGFFLVLMGIGFIHMT